MLWRYHRGCRGLFPWSWSARGGGQTPGCPAAARARRLKALGLLRPAQCRPSLVAGQTRSAALDALLSLRGGSSGQRRPRQVSGSGTPCSGRRTGQDAAVAAATDVTKSGTAAAAEDPPRACVACRPPPIHGAACARCRRPRAAITGSRPCWDMPVLLCRAPTASDVGGRGAAPCGFAAQVVPATEEPQ